MFYKQYRASFTDNLRKTGDIVIFKNNQALTEDEQLSPSFENAIVLWTLEKIDPRLPSKVKKDYGHQMTGNNDPEGHSKRCLRKHRPHA